MGKWKVVIVRETAEKNKTFGAFLVTTKGFAFNHIKNARTEFSWLKCLSENNFLKEVKSRVNM